ncbi:MAG: hypothetical protein JXP34_07930 [Planctomycetes bacterium]|nr:hypothetical protein [Planctomycetota bacterium]
MKSVLFRSACLFIVAACGLSLLFLQGIPRSAADCPGPAGTPCANGDVNADGKLNIGDPVYLLTYLFVDGPAPFPIDCGAASEDPLGRGYDVLGAYANRVEVKEPILDIGLLRRDGRIESIPIESSDFRSITGTNIDTYSSSLMQSCNLSGSYQGFSGAIRQSFSESRYTSTEYSYATVNILIHKWANLITDRLDTDSLKAYLTDTFRQRLNDPAYSSETLFETYGTHCMTGVITGARLDYNISARTSDISGNKSIGVYVEASYRSALYGASLDTSVLSEQEYSQYKTSEEKKLRAFGGSSEYAVKIATQDDYDAWLQTIADNPVFCDYYHNSLTPIWEFCEDAGRRTALEEAFGTWGDLRKIVVSAPPKLAILGVVVKNGYLGDDIMENGLRHHVLLQDLSEGAGGKTIITYAAVGLDNDPAHPPITSILFWDTEDPKTADLDTAYTRVSGDLNELAGGDTIFVYVSKDPGKGDPVRAIRTWNLSDGDYRYSEGASSQQHYIYVPNTVGAMQDTSEGAGGDTITLQYSKDYID